ncbi:hypothetical protein JOQ06_011758, partial [Pogonophryne albipinna]
RSPTQRLLHGSAESEPSLKAMSAFTAGSLQPELPALGRMVLFLLKLSGILGPELSETQGKDVFSKVT